MLALECETGMLLSYYKGGLNTENNVFVFSSAVLVTQCYVRVNLLQLFSCCTHERYQVPAADSVSCTTVAPGSRWSAAKMWNRSKLDWSLTCSRARVFGDEEWCRTIPHCASFAAIPQYPVVYT